MSEIKVYIYLPGKGKFYYAKYTDPVSGRVQTRSTKQVTRKAALKFAGQWESELREGRYKSPSRVTWAEFRRRYEDEALAALSDGTFGKAFTVFNDVEAYVNPDKLAALDAAQLSRLQKRWREEKKLSESTIKSNLAHLKAALNWAKRQGLLREVPPIDMPKRAKGSKLMKGRPVTAEEFERMLDVVPAVVGTDAADSWKFLLRGLWWSGLRLGEALNLHWDGHHGIIVDLQPNEFPMFRIPGDFQKSGNDELLPMTPEFFEMLQTVDVADRTGPVFRISHRTVTQASHIITDIGEKANVKVDVKPGRTAGKDGKIQPKVKWASAHDLRRSFGERWAQKVMPQVLQRLMRHSTIETTLRHYVGKDAAVTSRTVWQAVGMELPGSKKTKPAPPADIAEALSEPGEISCESDPR